MTAGVWRQSAARVDAFLVAPRASAGERLVTYLAALAGGGLAVVAAARTAVPVLALVVIAIVAIDAFGGAVANATNSAKRWWHRPGRTGLHHLGFVAVHLQPFLLAWAVPGFGWGAAAAIYAVAFASAVAIVATPARLRRPVGYATTVLGITGLLVLVSVPPALLWFVPVLLIKLLLAHLLPEGGNGE